MHLLNLLPLLLPLVALPAALASDLVISSTGTKDGVPIPVQLEPFDPVARRIQSHGESTDPGPRLRRVKRANTQVASNNWCGSVNTAPSSNPIKSIHAFFQHPSCSRRAGVTTYPQAAAAWIGIDGDSWGSSLLQSGTVCKIASSTSAIVHEAWLQWVPSGAYTLTNMPVAPGDWFEVTIETTSSTAGKITMTNLNQGMTVITTLSNGTALGRVDADWVVERPYYGSSLAGFASFTDVWFEEASATLANGANLGVLGAKQFHISGTCASVEVDDTMLAAWVP